MSDHKRPRMSFTIQIESVRDQIVEICREYRVAEAAIFFVR